MDWVDRLKTGNIQTRLGLLFLVFAFLVLVSVGTTYWGIEAQKEDALIINLAGRQRMLIQQMTRQTLEIAQGDGHDTKAALQEAISTFEQSLRALKEGGPAPYLAEFPAMVAPPRNQAILDQLDQITLMWGTFRNELQVVLQAETNSQEFQDAAKKIQQTSPLLVQQADEIVRLYSADSASESTRLKWVQVGFLASVLLLLGVGIASMRKSVLQPLNRLGKVAERIGEGDLGTPVSVEGPAEIQVFARTLEEMRSQLRASQQEAQALTDTLEERVAQRTRELEALYSVSREITSQLDIQYVLKSVADKARLLLNGDVAYLCMLDDLGRTLNLQSTSGPEGGVVQPSTSASLHLAGQVLAGESALKCGVQGCRGFCEIIATPYQTSHIAAPMYAAGRVIGALCVGSSQPHFFPDEALHLLTRLASVAAIALENARLYEQAERSAILEERQRLASDMHDGLAQTLGYLQMMIDLARGQIDLGKFDLALATMDQCHKATETAALETRRAIASLQQEIPRNCPLQEQLACLVNEFNQSGCKVEWKTVLVSPISLSGDEAEQVLRVVREALVNTRNHSHAKHVNVGLAQENGNLVVCVEDDGIGFDTTKESSSNGGRHFGLSIMRARASRIGGRLSIHSSPGEGTRVKLSWLQPLGNSGDRGAT